MQIRLDKIGDEPFLWEEELGFGAGELDRSELTEVGAVAVHGEVRRTEPGFMLRGRLSYRQTLVCDRCLAPITQPVDDQLELWVLTEGPQSAEPDRELEEVELGILYALDELVDTAPLVREQLHLNVPMKPLCRADCRGLCPTCGADLNRGRCGCVRDEVDPRWAALAELRSRFD